MANQGCIKCGSKDAGQKEVAMTGTGLSKMFDIQNNQFIVSTVTIVGTQNFILSGKKTPSDLCKGRSPAIQVEMNCRQSID